MPSSSVQDEACKHGLYKWYDFTSETSPRIYFSPTDVRLDNTDNPMKSRERGVFTFRLIFKVSEEAILDFPRRDGGACTEKFPSLSACVDRLVDTQLGTDGKVARVYNIRGNLVAIADFS